MEKHNNGHISQLGPYPASNKDKANVVLMLDQRRRRWTSVKTTLVQCSCLLGK